MPEELVTDAGENPKPLGQRLSELIDSWHFDSFHGTRLGNDVELWNQVHAAKDDLKRRLAAFLREA